MFGKLLDSIARYYLIVWVLLDHSIRFATTFVDT